MSLALVTGASGFIGKHLAQKLSDLGLSAICLRSSDGDVGSWETWTSLPTASTVFHLAGRSFVPDSWEAPQEFYRVNGLGTFNALQYCRERGARLVLVSSYMYGKPDLLPVSEAAEVRISNPYAYSKLAAENAAKFFVDQFGVSVRILRLFNVYGAGQQKDFLIPAIIEQVKGGGAITVKDLEPRRDYVYVADVVDAILSASSASTDELIFNIGSGQSYSVLEVITLIQEIWGSRLRVVCGGDRRVNEIPDALADNRLAQQELGWSPRYSLREGLIEILQQE